MSRELDLKWFLNNRKDIADKYAGKYVVIYNGEIVSAMATEEDAITFSLEKYGIDQASVFEASLEDPLVYIG